MFVRIASISMFALITSGLTVTARADVSIVQSAPTAITPKVAGDLAKKGDVVSSCTKVIFNTKNGRQKPVKGAAIVFAKGLPVHDDKAADALLEGKPVYTCKTKTWSASEGKFVNN